MVQKLPVEMDLQDCIFKVLVGPHKKPEEQNAMGRHIFSYQRQLHFPIYLTPLLLFLFGIVLYVQHLQKNLAPVSKLNS